MERGVRMLVIRAINTIRAFNRIILFTNYGTVLSNLQYHTSKSSSTTVTFVTAAEIILEMQKEDANTFCSFKNRGLSVIPWADPIV